MTVVTRQAMSDDSGVFTDGTVVNKAFVDQVYDQIDDQVHSATNPTIKPKTITDEVIAARGSKASLDARLDVALDEDGTLKLGFSNVSGGLRVGFAGSAAADTIDIGDATFIIDYATGNPKITFDTGDEVQFTRGTNIWTWRIAAANKMLLDASGLQITDGLVVGYAGTPVADEVRIGDTLFKLDFDLGGASVPGILFDTQDGFRFTRATNLYEFMIANVAELSLKVDGTTGTELKFPKALTLDGDEIGIFWAETASGVYFDWVSAYGKFLTIDPGTDGPNAILIGSAVASAGGIGLWGFISGGSPAAPEAQCVLVTNRTAAANPGTPVGGPYLYAVAGGLRGKGTGATVTTFAPAGPHCGKCGYDFWTVASENPDWGASLHICGMCGAEYRKGPRSVLARLTDDQRMEIIH